MIAPAEPPGWPGGLSGALDPGRLQRRPMTVSANTCDVFVLYSYDDGMQISFAIEGQKATSCLLDVDGHVKTAENMSRAAARRFAKRLVRQGRRRLEYRRRPDASAR